MTNSVELTAALRTNICRVTYTKASTGEEATMRCTLQESKLLPTKGTEVNDTDTLRVVDLDKNAWRSFRIANVKKIEIVA